MPLYAGIMSGTSLDGTDIALADIAFAETDPDRPRASVALRATGFIPYPADLRVRVQQLRHGQPTPVSEVCALHYELAQAYADALLQTLAEAAIAPSDLSGVGLHGQTVWHSPPSSGAAVPATLQLGQPAVLAERLGVPIVSDFRARDIAAGGEGAPLVPFADYLLLGSETETRANLNLGGIANVTYLPANGALSEVIAFDTGPGNLVIDGLTEALTGERYDRDGALAAQGTPDPALLAHLLAHPYFSQPPPKSTGAELFDSHYIAALLHRGQGLSTPDLLATATRLTADSVARALRDFLPRLPDRIITGGGGAHNKTLMAGLRQELPGVTFSTHEEFGIPTDAKEALAFALLAAATMNGLPSNVPSATGAAGPRLLGSVTRP